MKDVKSLTFVYTVSLSRIGQVSDFSNWFSGNKLLILTFFALLHPILLFAVRDEPIFNFKKNLPEDTFNPKKCASEIHDYFPKLIFEAFDNYQIKI